MLKTILAGATAILLALAAFADEKTVLADDIPWQDVIPGVQLALAWGDPAAGDDIWLLRMEPGTSLPRHLHTNDYWGLSISGSWVHVHEDGSEATTNAGDYVFVPGGIEHGDRCDGDVPCIGLLDFDGERDAIFPE